MYNMSMLRHWFSDKRGGLNHLPFVFCKVCNSVNYSCIKTKFCDQISFSMSSLSFIHNSHISIMPIRLFLLLLFGHHIINPSVINIFYTVLLKKCQLLRCCLLFFPQGNHELKQVYDLRSENFICIIEFTREKPTARSYIVILSAVRSV